MKFSDFDVIHQDSLTGKTFNQGRSKVLGWTSRTAAGNKVYVFQCSECANDPELHGDGLYQVMKAAIPNDGATVCGCGKCRWSEARFSILAKRKAEFFGFKFSGWSGTFNGNKTKLVLECEKHGVWTDTALGDFIRNKCGCKKCSNAKNGDDKRLSREEVLTRVRSAMIENGFDDVIIGFDDGGYKYQNTSRVRRVCKKHGEYTTKVSVATYYGVGCPSCAETGIRPNKPAHLYVSKWDTGVKQFIKIGISHMPPKRRMTRQMSGLSYKCELLYVFHFALGCNAARVERALKKSVEMRFCSKEGFPDGWTETTEISNLPLVLEVIEGFRCITRG